MNPPILPIMSGDEGGVESVGIFFRRGVLKVAVADRPISEDIAHSLWAAHAGLRFGDELVERAQEVDRQPDPDKRTGSGSYRAPTRFLVITN